MPGFCTTRTVFCSSAAITANRAFRASAVARFAANKRVSTQETAHHERFGFVWHTRPISSLFPCFQLDALCFAFSPDPRPSASIRGPLIFSQAAVK
jgi:hypothetical protein